MVYTHFAERSVVPIRVSYRHVPLGVLYDLVADGQLPWRLQASPSHVCCVCLYGRLSSQVAFVSSLPPELLPWDNDPNGELASLKRIFFSSLKVKMRH